MVLDGVDEFCFGVVGEEFVDLLGPLRVHSAGVPFVGDKSDIAEPTGEGLGLVFLDVVDVFREAFAGGAAGLADVVALLASVARAL